MQDSLHAQIVAPRWRLEDALASAGAQASTLQLLQHGTLPAWSAAACAVLSK